MKKQEDKKIENLDKQNQKKSPKEEKTHIENSSTKIAELSEEEQEELRAEAREKYSRLNGCGG
jgi:hypothetical protein